VELKNIQEEGDEGTGWRRSIGCLISWITFRKLATNYRALLRKMTYKDKVSYESPPPCSLEVFPEFLRRQPPEKVV